MCAVSFAKNEVNGLVCEYLVNPVGIDVVKPRLSWKIVSESKNVLQTAYEIRVAITEQTLENDNGLLWSRAKRKC
jgi:alpha-L-rhamnosidase